jgi:predicted RND superfamily exporter protein
LGDYAERFEQAGGGVLVGQTISVADVLKEIHKALNEGRPEFYAIPDNRRLIAQEFLLFENSGSDDLEDVVDSRFSMARLTAKVPWRDAATYVDSVRALTAKAKEIFAGQAEVTATGLMVLFASSIYNMMASTVVSYSIAAVVIALLMILMLGSVRIGLLSMLPNLYPIVFTLGMMGWLGLPLDMFTLLIGGIAIGLAVDDTIHFFHNYSRYHGQGMDARAAVRETMHTTGRAMLFTTLVLVSGFWVFMFASLNNLFSFGLLTGTTLIVALLADFTLAPALLASLERGRPAGLKGGGRP